MFHRAFAAFPHSRQAVSCVVRMNRTSATSRGILADKVALVTASTEGIGLAIARRLAQDGAHVVVSSRKQANVDQAVAKLQTENLSVSGLVCHVGKAEDRQRLIDAALERHGGIDILVSNAAVNPYFGSILGASEDVWDKILDINIKAAAMLVQLVVPHMEKRGGGSIVLVSSIAAYSPFSSLGPYNVSKTALLGLMRNYVEELTPRNIRINCLAPGLIRTKFSTALRQDEAVLEKVMENMRISRIGEPADCSGIVSFLCSPDADYITGETVVVAGGSPSRL
ncbi:dehydrogenase/reductase SDR family member 4-like [Sceloporus undulatus]|uniref:dehydrogenase/reductase SDR family member 4-like n=1 Tax=Sceloporus undulatus TaxID=8520 RepID=UPI001C4B0C4A|nr:dehydrogenase/reductase SDR family member 4-like [Sceloporus undulatus]